MLPMSLITSPLLTESHEETAKLGWHFSTISSFDDLSS